MQPNINIHLTDEVIDKIKSQADHIMRMYETDELRDKMIELSCEWFLKGIMHAVEKDSKTPLATLHSKE